MSTEICDPYRYTFQLSDYSFGLGLYMSMNRGCHQRLGRTQKYENRHETPTCYMKGKDNNSICECVVITLTATRKVPRAKLLLNGLNVSNTHKMFCEKWQSLCDSIQSLFLSFTMI